MVDWSGLDLSTRIRGTKRTEIQSSVVSVFWNVKIITPTNKHCQGKIYKLIFQKTVEILGPIEHQYFGSIH
jgi:hypothetical protein